MKAGRKKTPPKPVDPWYTVLARALKAYNFPATDATKETQLQTVWRHKL